LFITVRLLSTGLPAGGRPPGRHVLTEIIATMQKSGGLSLDFYHRIYRLGQRKVDPRIIASALKLPVRTVQAVLERFFEEAEENGMQQSSTPAATSKAEKPKQIQPEMSVYVFSRPRYAVVDIGGDLQGANVPALKKELDHTFDQAIKAVAVRLSDVHVIDDAAVQVLLAFHAACLEKGRFAAILDPSAEVDAIIHSSGMEERIQVYGTEHAFEEAAFRVDVKHSVRKKTIIRQNP